MGLRTILTAGIVVVCTAAMAAADSTFSPVRPPSIPLAVRSPYLSTWLDGDSGSILPGSWPHFWAGQITGWQGFIRVDNVTYNWMGAAPGPDPVTQTSFRYTSTKSIFTFDVAGKIALTATFLSPVNPDDLLRQSLQFAYLQLSVKSADGSPHNVQVYSDISGEWASSNNGQVINWDNGVNDGVAYHQYSLANPSVFTESGDMAEWGTWLFGTGANYSLTYRTGFSDVSTRTQFIDNGILDNKKDATFRAISDSWPVFAFSHQLGSVVSERDIFLVIGVAQDQVINFQGATPAPEALAALWTTEYNDPTDALSAFYFDWSTANTNANNLDAKIQNDAVQAGGQDYATLTTLAVRQVFGGLQVAHGSQQDYVFLKEISSDGDTQTVDVLFPAQPLFLYLNPSLLKLMLDPLFENQESGHYPNPWSIHDLGIFPNAIGYPGGNDEAMPVEECGNMIIMTLAYAQRTGDSAYLAQHWPLLEQWAQFLVNDSLIPDTQLSTDDFAGALANQTNLALKGIIGIRAMSEIAQRSGLTSAQKAAPTFLATAQDYITKWMGYGINANATPPHTSLSYDEPDSHGLLYNLYADRLLGVDLVPDSVYTMQSDFYPTVIQDFGVPLDSRHYWAKSDWQAFAAAIADSDTQSLMLGRLARFVEATQTNRPLTDLYDARTANFPSDGPSFAARPVVGGLFALLALPE
ncbi:hypothetical protein SPI_01184 [Niveomyces insectorum RCEF 264]|uniref:Glutaminase GtaA n=1 Tax=Niveomyces insectorum RCEF 264 TaxID=1081102 RepID=A0A167YRJ7_9HYPO|nr:hypothetical protein SPI_01184 [Niveomyces insectorum RCEF 264]